VRSPSVVDLLTHGSPKTGYKELPRLGGKEDEKAESNTLQTVSGRLPGQKSTAAFDLLN
jgi:hypothetical protein